MGKKRENKAKVKTIGKEYTISDLKKMGVGILPDDYLDDEEKNILTRIQGKPLRSWVMTIDEFLKRHNNKKVFIYPKSNKEIYWEDANNRKIIRGYAE